MGTLLYISHQQIKISSKTVIISFDYRQQEPVLGAKSRHVISWLHTLFRIATIIGHAATLHSSYV
jgi:hypothetical protein